MGYRQTGRAANTNIIFTRTSKASIESAIDKIKTKDFQQIVQNTSNIYGDGKSLNRAFQIIKNNTFNELLFKDEDVLERNYE